VILCLLNPTKGVGKAALHYTSEIVRRDLRAMATTLAPSFGSSGLDEVAIHFRCGDILSRNIPRSDNNYGLLQFRSYRKRIPENVTTIGIVTAPLSSAESRSQDRDYAPMCQVIVDRFLHYLMQHFPNATVTVRNDPNESIPQVMSRLILADYTFCVRSTFCLFPAIASYGSSFVLAGGVAYFFDPMVQVYDNIHLMEEDFLKSAEINEKGFQFTLEWLLVDDLSAISIHAGSSQTS
jgi:hypothetical protein